MRTLPGALAGLDLEAIRAEFPGLEASVEGKRLIYLDSACTALKSRAVAERMRDFYLNWGGCGGKRSTHLLSQQVEAWVVEARAAVAGFIGADSPSEIVFTSGATEAFNLVARSFPFDGARREVVLSDLEHNSVFLPFFESARRGESVLRLVKSRAGRVEGGDLEGMVGEKTALVVVTRASNVAGGLQPLAEIARLAHARGALVLSDMAQSVSSHRERVQETNVDFAAFSSHKLGGPFGLGVLYGKEHLLNRLGCYKVGGGSVKSVAWNGTGDPEVEYLDVPARLEAGVPNLGALPGLTEAIRWLGRLPQEALRGHIGALVRRAFDGLSRMPQIRVLGERERLEQGALVSFVPVHANFSATDFNLYLNHELEDRFIAVRTGEHCAHLLHRSLGIDATVRLSFFAYNTAAEVDAFLDALESYLKEACA